MMQYKISCELNYFDEKKICDLRYGSKTHLIKNQKITIFFAIKTISEGRKIYSEIDF